MNCVLVTGSSGFVGRYTLKPLLELGYEVYSERVELFDTPGVYKLMQEIRPTHLLHLAWLTTPGVFYESPDNLCWEEASLNLVRAFVESGGQRFVGAGTCFEMLTPSTFYGLCKNRTRERLESYCQKTGVEFAWGRIFSLYGPYERPERLVPSLVKSLLRGEQVACTRGDVVRDYMYIEDCATCFVDLVNSHKIGVFEVASGQSIQLKELMLAFGNALGRPDLIQLGMRPERPDEPQKLVPQAIPKWKPKTGLSDGITKTIDYWRHV